MTRRLPPLLRRLRVAISRFSRDNRGSITVEAMLVLPLWIWGYTMSYQFFDAFREQSVNLRAAYTISDMISREMVTVNDAYITGMDTLMESLIDRDQNVSLRVSSVTWSQMRERFEIHWSRSTDAIAMPALTTTTLQLLKDSIPNMSDGDYVVIVETRVGYEPAFDVGMDTQTLSQFIVTRPRFVPKVCLAGVTCS